MKKKLHNEKRKCWSYQYLMVAQILSYAFLWAPVYILYSELECKLHLLKSPKSSKRKEDVFEAEDIYSLREQYSNFQKLHHEKIFGSRKTWGSEITFLQCTKNFCEQLSSEPWKKNLFFQGCSKVSKVLFQVVKKGNLPWKMHSISIFYLEGERD